MFNVGGPEVLVILVLALIVLGPQRLPDAAKQIGRFMGELRRMSSGFQHELRAAMDDSAEQAARQRGAGVRPTTPDAPAVAPVPPSAAATAPGPRTAAKKAAPRKRTAPLRAVPKSDDPPAP